MNKNVCVYMGELLQRYNFGERHPFGPRRQAAFMDEFYHQELDQKVVMEKPIIAAQEQIEWFHLPDYVERVKHSSIAGRGFLDYGDTPAFPGVYEAAAAVVGTVLKAVDGMMTGSCRRAFIPIAGLHHARREAAAGFCVFNDCGVAIEALRRQYGVQRIGYVDIDAHHGDGVFYGFEEDPNVIIVDLHEDGRYLYPGTGSKDETGTGPAVGSKLNIPMPPGATDKKFLESWEQAEAFLKRGQPEFILFQCGADSLAGDPLTHLGYSPTAHAHAAKRLCAIAEQYSSGRILGLGGGGYDLDNLAKAWCAVVQAFVTADVFLSD
ncbi:Histone deacetylase superfamily [Nitrosococcus oceani ATCC 19707]|uniref:Acetoin utilization protein AcuC n=2 Tax=Nitrosococcus oceani TaxID=1229 RepID=Q3JCH3_NITOC|nr:acetoin utilization protein AcuC [Nitrosococcus oceani]ABA57473.1 Histone deacetylase superfamily [Nitrosococcus oceani ATCC 19707]EDZ67664.1 Histone deacetylase family, putative [Nitrosococcus oceani AFC27]KFI20104.1 histone deacetylase [Nitrosococcus oceani C-27]GEM21721.1 acetoin utilization protein AcuC [Nitrosococcus oceani]